MTVSVLRGVHEVETEQRAVPVPAEGEVLIRVAAIGTCGSDVHYYEQGRIGDAVVREPLVLGHEASGVVVACGPGARQHVPGTRVAIEPGVPCGRCTECRLGRYNLCPDMVFFGTPPVDGAFAEYVTLREEFAYPLPDSLSDEAGALLEPLSVGVWGARKARIGPGARVLVTGAGPIGLIAAQTARAFGASEVLVTDVNEHRLAVAGELGARTIDVGREALTGVAADVLLECSGNPRATLQGIAALGRAGRAVLIGMGADELALPVARVQQFELEVTGTFRYANTWPTAIELAASGAVRLDRLVTHRFPLTEVRGALTIAARDPATIKPVVVPM
ncbi:NAD(P)-dependent alcohol dehydrogenase [Sciscionella marina]|uniref:NAD(P)-dependent alcohol dehydrogenase n=1 Tax=Sciscionella marina TaxID=508770 RepID=UPI00058AC7A4|nr:NAD(P)-dependent alcohol dehydrogenase [Sciscionella marina]